MEENRAANQRSEFSLSFTLALYISNGFGLRDFFAVFDPKMKHTVCYIPIKFRGSYFCAKKFRIFSSWSEIFSIQFSSTKSESCDTTYLKNTIQLLSFIHFREFMTIPYHFEPWLLNNFYSFQTFYPNQIVSVANNKKIKFEIDRYFWNIFLFC